MVYCHRRIVLNYLRTSFPLDLISSLPLDLVTAPFMDDGSATVLRAVRSLPLNKPVAMPLA